MPSLLVYQKETNYVFDWKMLSKEISSAAFATSCDNKNDLNVVVLIN